jgi:hypothetical protein
LYVNKSLDQFHAMRASAQEGNMEKKKGPAAGTLKIEGAWESAVGRALGKPRPAGGWPERPKKARKPKKSK